MKRSQRHLLAAIENNIFGVPIIIALCGLLSGPFYGLMFHFMVFHGRISSFLAVIDPNSFGLVVVVLLLLGVESTRP